VGRSRRADVLIKNSSPRVFLAARTLTEWVRRKNARPLTAGMAQSEKWRAGQMTSALNPNTDMKVGVCNRGRLARPSNQLHPLQTRMPVLADDDVVVDGNAERGGDIDDRFRHLNIGPRGRRIAGGMVVHQDYRATSNGHYQRMSVSVVACPRNQSKIFDRSLYSMCGANPGITLATSGTNANTCGRMRPKR
jgi:hypothetical protein